MARKQRTEDRDAATLARQVGRRIRALRVEGRGPPMTQGEIAQRAHISVSFLSMIERGERSAGLATLADITEALGTSLLEIFSADEFRPQATPAFQLLAAYLHRRKVTRKQVKQLLAIAEAMYAE